ncbi:hypothetical protein K239x_34250 [Planctomycetes bacterium K23_9]|uniref:Uncharacterized protein n=2 Tax=Stieleria marina TaxID=1930275 RepID=A0A517NWE6_9BACT|nr:hypothetical protein K239x_34250 [Planctomycetes bacterium K23_9]
MLELIAATTIITIALVPALRLTRDGVARSEELENAEMRLALCTSKLEEEMARTAASWNLTTQVGDFGDRGWGQLRFMVAKSDAIADGGIPDSLATIDVVVWHDEDAGNDLDSNERQTRLTTKLAKLISYEYEATIH